MSTRTPDLEKCIEEAKQSLQEYLDESVITTDTSDTYLDGFVDGWTKAIELLKVQYVH
jgi:hypothetical protein